MRSPRGALGVTMGGVALFAIGLILIGGNCGTPPPGTSISDATSREGACAGGFLSLIVGAAVGAGGLGWLLYSSSALNLRQSGETIEGRCRHARRAR